jgi:hypothetical protein
VFAGSETVTGCAHAVLQSRKPNTSVCFVAALMQTPTLSSANSSFVWLPGHPAPACSVKAPSALPSFFQKLFQKEANQARLLVFVFLLQQAAYGMCAGITLNMGFFSARDM